MRSLIQALVAVMKAVGSLLPQPLTPPVKPALLMMSPAAVVMLALRLTPAHLTMKPPVTLATTAMDKHITIVQP